VCAPFAAEVVSADIRSKIRDVVATSLQTSLTGMYPRPVDPGQSIKENCLIN
jgi:hypothetical protein